MPIGSPVDTSVLHSVLSVAPYVGAGIVALVVGSLAMHFFKKRRVVSSDDLARFNSKFPLDYIARNLNDNEFDPDAFLKIVRTLFVEFHQGIQSGSIDRLHRFMTDELFESRTALVVAREKRGEQAVMKNFKLHGLTIRDATSIHNYDAITVRILASSADYEVDSTGRVFGDKTVRAWEEDWIFDRSLNKATKLKDVWTLSAINTVDRNRFRPDAVRHERLRQQQFQRGEAYRG